jgi:hypothetical protein
VELLDAAGAVYAGAKAYPDPPKIRQDFEEEARLVETLFELEAGKALGEGDLGKGLECYGNTLMVSTRYLGGKRMTDYAYAMTMLQSFQDQAGAAAANPQGNQSLKTVFGDAIRAGQKFYGMQEQVVAGKASALVASDFGKALSVDGGDYADAPQAVEPAVETRTLSVQAKGEEKPIAVTAAAKARLLFVQDGFAAFGKVESEGTQAQPVAVKEAAAPIALQWRSVKLKGKEDDWAGVKATFSNSEGTTKPQISGSRILGGIVCRDEKYLYCRIDFGNGRLTLSTGSSMRLELTNDNTSVSFGLEAFAANNQGGGSSGVKYLTMERVSTPTTSYALEIGSSAEGKSSIELSLPLSELSRNLDFSKPIKARVVYVTGPTNGWYGFEIASSSPYVDIVLGDRNSDSASAPSSAPKLRVTHAFGSISLTTAIDGTLYLDGASVGELSAGDKATLDSVKVGDRSIEIHYPDGQVEKKSVIVEEGQVAVVSFAGPKTSPLPAASTTGAVDGEPVTLRRQSIGMKGKDEEWAGIEAIFSGSKNTKTPKIPGSRIAGGRVCRDDKYLYCRIDYANGKLKLTNTDSLQLQLIQDDNAITLAQESYWWCTGNSWLTLIAARMHVATPTDSTMADIDSSTKGASFVELRVPLTMLSSYLDFSRPIRARVAYYASDNGGGPAASGGLGPPAQRTIIASSSPYVQILIGE